jgi:uncharacterized protein (DUF1330 family)
MSEQIVCFDVAMTPDQEPSGLTLAFYGLADREQAEAARAFEDEVLDLVPLHGGRVVFRGHRRADEPDSLPAECHVLWFPSEDALAPYMADQRRAELLARHGEAFSEKVVVRVDVLSVGSPPTPEGEARR